MSIKKKCNECCCRPYSQASVSGREALRLGGLTVSCAVEIAKLGKALGDCREIGVAAELTIAREECNDSFLLTA